MRLIDDVCLPLCSLSLCLCVSVSLFLCVRAYVHVDWGSLAEYRLCMACALYCVVAVSDSFIFEPSPLFNSFAGASLLGKLRIIALNSYMHLLRRFDRLLILDGGE